MKKKPPIVPGRDHVHNQKVIPFRPSSDAETMHPEDCDCDACEQAEEDALEEDDDDCDCDDCSCGQTTGGMGIISLTEQTLDLLATLTEYRNGTKMTEASPILDRVEGSLLRYLSILSRDLEKASLEDSDVTDETAGTH